MLRVFVILCGLSLCENVDSLYARARVESCKGCALNRLPEVKQFINEDLPNYDNVQFKHIRGADPELVLLSARGMELDRIPLKNMRRGAINFLMQRKGFNKRGSNYD